MCDPKSEKVLLAFQDVVTCFSKKERELLHKWQKDLYANLMKEINQVLMLLGPMIAKSVFSLRAEEKEELADISSKIKEEVEVCSLDQQSTGTQQSKNRLVGDTFAASRNAHSFAGEKPLSQEELRDGENPGEEFTIVMISDYIKDDGAYSRVDQDHKELNNVCSPAGVADVASLISPNIKEEVEACSLDLQISEMQQTIDSLTAYPSESGSMSENESNTCSPKTQQGIPKSESSFTCTDCGKRFSGKTHLLMHQQIHTGVRPYQCTECEKSFNQKGNLVTHLRIHTGVKPFHCTMCEKSFNQKGNLLTHLRIHTGGKPFQCTVCEKSFTQKHVLLMHQCTHTGVRPFQCTECDKSFIRKNNLKEHQIIHKGERAFHCNVCEKSFTYKQNLIAHQRIHTGERPFQCPQCEKSFTRKRYLLNHQNSHTNESHPMTTQKREALSLQ
ncbi:zinc finger protein 182-like isoform X2 [Pleurodeles waltl]|uniref:zinc finger protein 182-like isoform X2 n=1 Tax=Pleurodeles waltl TaxID=8319 RepID=UPI0037093EC9